LKTVIKYFAVTGPSCVGKTSASKLIATDGGYRHIEYEPYIASIKEKLIAPEDGE
jgi:broad-specificity NMP kinase